MTTPFRHSTRLLALLFVSGPLVTACFHKPNQYDPTQDPALFPPEAGPRNSAGMPREGDARMDPGPEDGPESSPMPNTDPVAPCPEGFHLCGTRCADNLSPDTCGVGCESCPSIAGGMSTCDGRKCSVVCPAGQKPCLDSCVAEGAACDGACSDGKNLCNGICVLPTSLSACGSSCSPCPSSAGGVASCDGDKCDLNCNEGFHRCEDACVKDTDPRTCGASCTTCPVPTGGQATCDGVKCGARCPDGMTPCRGACIQNNQACNGVCPAGQQDCDGLCVPVNTVNFCGPTCTSCGSRDNATSTCENNTCVYNCRAGYQNCPGDICLGRPEHRFVRRLLRALPRSPKRDPQLRWRQMWFHLQPRHLSLRECLPWPEPAVQRHVPARFQALRRDMRRGELLPGRTVAGGSCNACVNNRCQNTTNGQPSPGCTGTCQVCQGGVCIDRPNTQVCGSACIDGSACCVSGQIGKRCSDGRCVPTSACCETCNGPCQQCENGTCTTRPNTKVCGSACVPATTCCLNNQPGCGACRSCQSNGQCSQPVNCPGPCQRCNSSGTGCDNTTGACTTGNGEAGTCAGGSCRRNCNEGGACSPGNVCQTGRISCDAQGNQTCVPATRPDNEFCGGGACCGGRCRLLGERPLVPCTQAAIDACASFAARCITAQGTEGGQTCFRQILLWTAGNRRTLPS